LTGRPLQYLLNCKVFVLIANNNRFAIFGIICCCVPGAHSSVCRERVNMFLAQHSVTILFPLRTAVIAECAHGIGESCKE